MKTNLIYTTIILLVFTGACTPKHMLVYFQDEQIEGVPIYSPEEIEYLIQPGDNLYIEVLSIDEDVLKVYNGNASKMQMSNIQDTPINSYLVSPQGYIAYPFVGKIEVLNKSLEQIELDIKKKINIDQTEVIARLSDRSISILGEVRSPGKYTISKNQINIYQAITLAGDITDYGNRTRVRIVHTEGEEKYLRTVDLTVGSLLQDQTSLIFPNDIIYVEPLGRSYGHKTITTPLVISIATSIVALVIAITSL